MHFLWAFPDHTFPSFCRLSVAPDLCCCNATERNQECKLYGRSENKIQLTIPHFDLQSQIRCSFSCEKRLDRQRLLDFECCDTKSEQNSKYFDATNLFERLESSYTHYAYILSLVPVPQQPDRPFQNYRTLKSVDQRSGATKNHQSTEFEAQKPRKGWSGKATTKLISNTSSSTTATQVQVSLLKSYSHEKWRSILIRNERSSTSWIGNLRSYVRFVLLLLLRSTYSEPSSTMEGSPKAS